MELVVLRLALHLNLSNVLPMNSHQGHLLNYQRYWKLIGYEIVLRKVGLIQTSLK